MASLSTKDLPQASLTVRDKLLFKLDLLNPCDAKAVLIFKGHLEIGYSKKNHCKNFHKPGAENLKISIKTLENNDKIKKVFVKVIM